VVDARRQILDASVALVAEQGVRAVSFREVARRAGVSHQTPYHHFGDYRGILVEIAREGFAALAEAMESAAAGSPDPIQALAEAGLAYVEFAQRHVGSFRLMFQQPPDTGPRPDLAEAERTFAVVSTLAEAVVDAGYGRGLSPSVVAQLCWATVHGLATLTVEGLLSEKLGPPGGGDAVVMALADVLR
jgi:AcrR family transcriptional regulator